MLSVQRLFLTGVSFLKHQKVQHLEKKLSDIEIAENKLEQYTRRNNIEIQGIPSSVHDNLLEDKVIDIFSQLNITISKSDIEDRHRLGKANPKNNSTICQSKVLQ